MIQPAAPLKSGLDYYSHYIGMTCDDKLSGARMEYGSVAIDIWLVLLDMIYSGKGYYLVYDSLTKKQVVWTVLGCVRGKYPPTPETVEGIIECLVACELFSGDLFKHGILSSKRIQVQYYLGTVERKAVRVDPDIWLLDIDEMSKLSGKSPILHFFINRPNNEVNQPNNSASKIDKAFLEKKYGAAAVSKYETKFDDWSARQGFVRAEKYSTIAKWMNQDKIPEILVTTDADYLEPLF